MKIEAHRACPDYGSYRASRVKSLFNAEHGRRFDLEIDTDIDSFDWQIGVIVGPSGSGKSSIGREFFPTGIYDMKKEWPADEPVIDAIYPEGDFNAVTSALSLPAPLLVAAGRRRGPGERPRLAEILPGDLQRGEV